MVNNIDKIITLEDNTKFMILDQGNYNGKSYYLTSELDDNDNLTEKFAILEEDNNSVDTVKSDKLLKALIEYFTKRFEVVAK